MGINIHRTNKQSPAQTSADTGAPDTGLPPRRPSPTAAVDAGLPARRASAATGSTADLAPRAALPAHAAARSCKTSNLPNQGTYAAQQPTPQPTHASAKAPGTLARLRRAASKLLRPPAKPQADTSMGVFGGARGINRDAPLASKSERPQRVRGYMHDIAGMASQERQHGMGKAADFPARIPAMDFASVLHDMKYRPKPGRWDAPSDELPPERNRFPAPDPAADTRRLRQAITAPQAELDGLGADAPKLSRMRKTLPLAAPALHRPLMDKVFKTQKRGRGGQAAGAAAAAPHLQQAQQQMTAELRAKEAVRVARISQLRTRAYIARAERNLLDAEESLRTLEHLHDPRSAEVCNLRQSVALRVVFHPDTLPAAGSSQAQGRQDAAAAARQVSPALVSRHVHDFTDRVFADLVALRDLPDDTRLRILGPKAEALLQQLDAADPHPVLRQLAAQWHPVELAQREAESLHRAETLGQRIDAQRQDLGWPLRKISAPAVEAMFAPLQQEQARAGADAQVLRQLRSLSERLRLLPRVEAAASVYFSAAQAGARSAQAAAQTRSLLEPTRQAVQQIRADIAVMRAHLRSQEQQAEPLAQALAAAQSERQAAERAASHELLRTLDRHGFRLGEPPAPDQPTPQAPLQMALGDLYLRLEQRAGLPDNDPGKPEPRASSPAMVVSATVHALAEAAGGDVVLAAEILAHLGQLHLTDLVKPEAAATRAGAGALHAARLLAQVPRGMEILQHLTGYEGLAALQGTRPLAPDMEAVKVYLLAHEALGRTPPDQPALQQFRSDALEAARLSALSDDPAEALAAQTTPAQRGAFHALRNGMDSNAPGTDYDQVRRSLLLLGRWLGQLETPHSGAPRHDMTPLKALDQAVEVLDATGGASLRRIHSDTLRIAVDQLLVFASAEPEGQPPSHGQAALQSLLQTLAYQPEDVDLGKLKVTPAMLEQARATATARGLAPGTEGAAQAFAAVGERVSAGPGLGVAALLDIAALALAREPHEALQDLREHLPVVREQAELLASGRPDNTEMFIRKLKYTLANLQWRERTKMSMIDTVGINTDRPVSIPVAPFVAVQPKLILGVDRKKEVALEFFMSSPSGPQIVFGTKRSTGVDLGAGLGVAVSKPMGKAGFADTGTAQIDGTQVAVTKAVPAATLGGRAALEARFKGERTQDESVSIRIPRYLGREGTLHQQFVDLMQDLFLIAHDAHAAQAAGLPPPDPLLQLLAAQPAASVGRLTGRRSLRAAEVSGDIAASAGLGGKHGGMGGGVGFTARREKVDADTNPRAHIAWPTADSTVATRVTTRVSTAYATPPLYTHSDTALTQTPEQAAHGQATQASTMQFSIPGVALGGTATGETRVAEFHKRMAEQTYAGGEHFYDWAARGFETTDFKMFKASVMARLSQWSELAAIRAPAGIPEEDRYALGEKFVLDMLAQGEAIRARNTTTSATSFDILFQELDAQVDHLNREAWFARRRGDTGTAAHIDALLDELFSDPSIRRVALMHVSNTTRASAKLGINQIAKISTVWQGESKATMAQVPQANPIVDKPSASRGRA